MEGHAAFVAAASERHAADLALKASTDVGAILAAAKGFEASILGPRREAYNASVRRRRQEAYDRRVSRARHKKAEQEDKEYVAKSAHIF